MCIQQTACRGDTPHKQLGEMNMYDSITVKKELCMHDLDDFLWSGAKDRWDGADEYTKERVWKRICTWAEYCGVVVDDTWVNDTIWFECDDLFYPDDEEDEESDDGGNDDGGNEDEESDDEESDDGGNEEDEESTDQDADQPSKQDAADQNADQDADQNADQADDQDDHANACVMCGETAEWETSDGERMCLACVLEAYDITPAKPCCAYCGETLPLADKDTMVGDNGVFYCDENCALRAHGCSRV